MLYQLSYAPKGDGTRTRNLRMRRNPRLRSRPTSNFKEHDNCRGIVWLRGQGSNLDLLFQRQAWFRFHHLARVWLAVRVCAGLDGEIRTPNLRFPIPARSRCATSSRTDGGIRTRTDGVLSAVPLPLGYVSACVCSVDRAGLEPATFSLQGSCASSCATGPDLCAACWSRGRESNPRAGRMRPRCTQCPRRGDRSDSNRLPPGPRPGVSTTSDLGHSRRGGSRTPDILRVKQAVYR